MPTKKSAPIRKLVNYREDPKQIRRLKKVAKKEGVPLAHVIRRAVDRELKRVGA